MSNIYTGDIMAHEVHKKDSPMNKILIFIHRILEFVYIEISQNVFILIFFQYSNLIF